VVPADDRSPASRGQPWPSRFWRLRLTPGTLSCLRRCARSAQEMRGANGLGPPHAPDCAARATACPFAPACARQSWHGPAARNSGACARDPAPAPGRLCPARSVSAAGEPAAACAGRGRNCRRALSSWCRAAQVLAVIPVVPGLLVQVAELRVPVRVLLSLRVSFCRDARGETSSHRCKLLRPLDWRSAHIPLAHVVA
jgi:hypothetical protein